MKKRVSLLMALLALILPALAEGEDWYLSTSTELAQRVGELARDDAFTEMNISREFSCMEPARAADYSTLKSAYRVQLPDEAGMRVLTKMMYGGDISETACEYVVSGFANAFVNQYIAMEGAEVLAASTLLTYARTYEMPEDFENVLYVLEFEGAVIGVTFTGTGDTTITATAKPFLSSGEVTIDGVLQGISEGEIPVAAEKIF